MTKTWNMVPAQPSHVSAIERLLLLNTLPANDVGRHLADFVIARTQDRVIGAAGVERYPPFALLRSVVVDPVWRGQGIARALTDCLMQRLRANGLSRVYLLTESAADYFSRLGFERCPRDSLPRELADAPQQKTLCCASAQAMVRAL